MLGVDEEAPRTDAVKPKGKTASVAFRRGAGQGEVGAAQAIAAALQSDEQTDSEVQFAVLSVDAKGEEKGSASRR